MKLDSFLLFEPVCFLFRVCFLVFAQDLWTCCGMCGPQILDDLGITLGSEGRAFVKPASNMVGALPMFLRCGYCLSPSKRKSAPEMTSKLGKMLSFFFTKHAAFS